MALPRPDPGSTALVTGASSGIGREFARHLAARGYGLTIVARRRDRLEELATELSGAHKTRVEIVVCDLSDPAARDRLAAEVAEQGHVVEVLVNSAGFGTYADFAKSPREREVEQVRLNVEAVTDLTARYLPDMVSRGRGAIVNLASTSGLQPTPGNATYAASKSFVLFHSEALHSELEGSGVTITAVLPGPVPTEFQEANDAEFAEKLPKIVWTTPARVATDALAAADAGKRSIIPGGLPVRAAFAGNRFVPKALVLSVGKRLMSRSG
jgi:short-subunit dehydrogenase